MDEVSMATDAARRVQETLIVTSQDTNNAFDKISTASTRAEYDELRKAAIKLIQISK
jgi:hypothetical protein